MAYQPTLTLLGLRMRATVDRQLAASALPTTWPSIDAHQLEQRVLLEQQRATAADAFTLPAAATRSDGYTGNGAPSTSGTWPAAPVSAPPHASTATASQADGARRRPPPPPPGSSCDPAEVPAGSHAVSPASARDEQARQSASRAERHAERALEVAEQHTERALQLSAEMSVLSETVKEVAAASNTSAMQSVELSRAANSPARGAAQRMDGPDSFSRAAVPFDGNWHGPGVGELDTPVAVPDQASIVAAELALEAERRSTEALLLAIAEMDDDASEGGFTLDSQESASEFHTQAVARSQTLLEVHAAEMGQWRRVTLVLAWTCWVERTTSRSNAHHRAEQMGQRVIARLAHTELARALAAWIRWSAIKRRHAQLLKRAAARMSRSGLACALEGWRQYWMHAAQVRSTAQRVVLHFRGGLVARAFTSWSEQARWRVRSRLLVSHQLLRWVRSTEYHFFEAWRLAAAEAHRQRVLADEREQRWLLHLNYRDQQRHQRRLYGSFASWRVSVMRLRNGPEDNIDAAALQWNALSKSAVEIAAEERAKEEETAAEKQRAAKETARRLAQEQAARAAAEERAKQESQRLEQLTSVLQRAEQRARAMDLTIAEKSQRLSAAEAQLSWLMLGNPAATEDSDSSVGSPVLLARRSSLSPPHRLADGSGISLDFRRAISRSYGRGDGDGYDWPSFDDSVETNGQGLEDAWSAVADMAVGSPSNASTAGRSSPQGKRPSRMQGLAAQRRPA